MARWTYSRRLMKGALGVGAYLFVQSIMPNGFHVALFMRRRGEDERTEHGEGALLRLRLHCTKYIFHGNCSVHDHTPRSLMNILAYAMICQGGIIRARGLDSPCIPTYIESVLDHCPFLAFSSAASFSLSSSFIATITYAMSTTLAMIAAVAPAHVEFPKRSFSGFLADKETHCD